MLLSETHQEFKNFDKCRVKSSLALFGKPFIAGDKYNYQLSFGSTMVNIFLNLQNSISISLETFKSNFEII